VCFREPTGGACRRDGRRPVSFSGDTWPASRVQNANETHLGTPHLSLERALPSHTLSLNSHRRWSCCPSGTWTSNQVLQTVPPTGGTRTLTDLDPHVCPVRVPPTHTHSPDIISPPPSITIVEGPPAPPPPPPPPPHTRGKYPIGLVKDGSAPFGEVPTPISLPGRAVFPPSCRPAKSKQEPGRTTTHACHYPIILNLSVIGRAVRQPVTTCTRR
jgi:hypothetical protein